MRLKPLIYCHLAVLCLLGTFLFPPTRVYWDIFDVACFKFLNGTLTERPGLQAFWALANHKLTDWVEDLIFIAFFAMAIYQAEPGKRLKKLSQFIFCILFAATMIYGVNRVLFREHLKIPRPSPSLVVTPCVRVSDTISWIKTKEKDSSSFPGDHATTVIFFAVSYTFFAGRRLGSYAIAYALLRSLPRLIIGAHWFTDVFVGSGSIVLFFSSWALCTSFHMWITNGIQAFLKIFSYRKIPLR
jgi:membrane-associated phospholipid phosphatase